MNQEQTMLSKLPKSNQKKLSKSDIVYEFLLNGIINAKWLPGDRINDKEIAEHLGVNRLAAREALSRLVQDEVVEQEPWKGYHIREITEDVVRSMVEVRIALEELAMTLLLKKDPALQKKYFARMRQIINESSYHLERNDHVKYMEIDFRFHELLYEASGNLMIAKIITTTRITTSIMRNLSMGKDIEEFIEAARASIQDHEQLLQALEAGNLKKACAILQEHLGITFVENILKHII